MVADYSAMLDNRFELRDLLSNADDEQRSRYLPLVAEVDAKFIAKTEPDTEELVRRSEAYLAKYDDFRDQNASCMWVQRIPLGGVFRRALEEESQREYPGS